MNRNTKLAIQLQAQGIDLQDPRLRIREGASGAHTIPAGYRAVFDQEIDSVRVRAFLPTDQAELAVDRTLRQHGFWSRLRGATRWRPWAKDLQTPPNP